MNSNRINFVDVARAYAIALVTFGHAMGEFGAWDDIPDRLDLPARLLTRTGTPIFVLLFGMMIELVHVRRAETGGIDALRPRLRRRALECYGGYVLVSFAALVGGRVDGGHFAKSLVLMAGGGYGTILAIYAVALMALPGVLRLRLRLGSVAAPTLLAGLWLLDAVVLDRFDGRDAGTWAYTIDTLLGAGRHIRGPSVLHSFTFVLAGMVLAQGLHSWRTRGARDFLRRAAAVAGIAGAIAAVLVWRDGVDAVVDGFRYYRGYRRDNAIGYFALGTLGALGVLVAACAIVPRRRLPSWTAGPLQLGRSSLLAFALGSAGLHLLSDGIRRALAPWGITAAVGYVAFLTLAVNWRRLVRVTTGLDGPSGPATPARPPHPPRSGTRERPDLVAGAGQKPAGSVVTTIRCAASGPRRP